jgi:hypothetical protein
MSNKCCPKCVKAVGAQKFHDLECLCECHQEAPKEPDCYRCNPEKFTVGPGVTVPICEKHYEERYENPAPKEEKKLCQRGFELGQECGHCKYCVARKEAPKDRPFVDVFKQQREDLIGNLEKNLDVSKIAFAPKEQECECYYSSIGLGLVYCDLHRPAPKEQEEWEERFDKEFAGDWNDGDDIQIKIKSFIRQLLTSQREEMIEKVEKMRGKNKNWTEVIEIAYDEAIDDVVSILKGK